ncbi:MAG: hypothetical protein ABI378_06565 [Chitinophagaceae bacterium]
MKPEVLKFIKTFFLYLFCIVSINILVDYLFGDTGFFGKHQVLAFFAKWIPIGLIVTWIYIKRTRSASKK